MNTQLNIKLASGNSVIGLTYKPTEFQIGYSGTKDIKTILKMSSSSTKLHESLITLNKLLSTEFNIYDHLISRGISDVDEKLKLKKLTIPRLFNSIPFTKVSEISKLLSDSFIKESDFYDFSIGMLDYVSQNIQRGLDYDFVKINRRIDPSWTADIIVETTEGYTYQTKTSSFSFKDNYKFELSSLDESNTITKVISDLFVASIRPYADIFMEKIIPDTFRSIHSFGGAFSRNIHHQFEQLAWELYTPTGTQRHSDNSEIYSKFAELTALFFEQNSIIPYNVSTPLPRAITFAVSAASTCEETNIKFDYTKFDTYHNTFHQQWIVREKDSLEHPKMMDICEIETLIHRVKRYFGVVKIGEVAFDNIIGKKDAYTCFADIVSNMTESIYKYVDSVCELYALDAEISE